MKDATFGSQKIDNRTAILIIGLLTGGLILQMASLDIQLETTEKTETLKNLIIGINGALYALVFIILAIKNMNKYLIAAFGGLIGTLIPLVSSITLFLDPVTDLAKFYVIFVLYIVGWFLSVIVSFEKAQNRELVENALPHIKKMFTILAVVAIWLYAIYLITINFDKLFLSS